MFNPKIFPIVAHQHWVFLTQVAFDNLSFVVNEGINRILFKEIWTNRVDLVNMGLKLGIFISDPTYNFE